MTEKLVKILADLEIVPDVKEILCYMHLEYDTEHKLTAPIDKEKTYVLPDGNITTLVEHLSDGNISTVGAERFRCVEVLFQPSPRIHGTSSQNNMKCDVDIHKNLYTVVLLSGGTSMFHEIVERMTN